MITQEGFAEAGPDAADADGAGTILDSGQAPSPHTQGWNKPQGETPRSDLYYYVFMGGFEGGS